MFHHIQLKQNLAQENLKMPSETLPHFQIAILSCSINFAHSGVPQPHILDRGQLSYPEKTSFHLTNHLDTIK